MCEGKDCPEGCSDGPVGAEPVPANVRWRGMGKALALVVAYAAAALPGAYSAVASQDLAVQDDVDHTMGQVNGELAKQVQALQSWVKANKGQADRLAGEVKDLRAERAADQREVMRLLVELSQRRGLQRLLRRPMGGGGGGGGAGATGAHVSTSQPLKPSPVDKRQALPPVKQSLADF